MRPDRIRRRWLARVRKRLGKKLWRRLQKMPCWEADLWVWAHGFTTQPYVSPLTAHWVLPLTQQMLSYRARREGGPNVHDIRKWRPATDRAVHVCDLADIDGALSDRARYIRGRRAI